MHILLIEDNEKLAKYLKRGLEHEGYSVDYCLDGEEGQTLVELNHEAFDIIILDIMLPIKNGIEICQELRKQSIFIPIIMLTAKIELKDKINGLDAGADDYLLKPFSFDELVARIRALLRRPKTSLPMEIRIGQLSLQPSKRKVFYEQEEIPLTLKEFNLLEYFMRHPNQVLNREQILDKLWDLNYDSFSNVVDVHIKNLRKKLEDVSGKLLLETVRGVGYRLKA